MEFWKLDASICWAEARPLRQWEILEMQLWDYKSQADRFRIASPKQQGDVLSELWLTIKT